MAESTGQLQKCLRVTPHRGLVFEDVPVPTSDDGLVEVEVAFVGICGSDLHYARHGRNGDYIVRAPFTLGHEVSGVVMDVPEGTSSSVRVGHRVVLHPCVECPPPNATVSQGENRRAGIAHLGSAGTFPHVDGGLSRRISVRPEQLRVIPDELPLKRAALAEPLAVALHGVSMVGDLGGRSVLVSGAGPVGLLSVLAARHGGAKKITATDLQDHALEKATKMGADETINLAGNPNPPSAEFDVVIEASGAPAAAASAMRSVAPGGVVVQVGIQPSDPITLPYATIIAKEAIVRGSWRFDIELDSAVQLLNASPEADSIISHVVPFENGIEAFDIAGDSSQSSKVLISVT